MSLLAFDIGTSALKCTLLSNSVSVIASADYRYPTQHLPDGGAQQQPEHWWDGVCQTSRNLISQVPEAMDEVEAVGVSGHMLGCLPLDTTGAPLHPALIHSDSRAASPYQRIKQEVGPDLLYKRTGNVLDPRSSLCKVLWFKQEQIELYKKTAVFVQSKDYITGRLSGKFNTTDFSDASHAQWIDLERKEYLHDIFQILGIASEKFPELHKGTDLVGKICSAAARETGLKQGIPVIAGGGDGACANAAAGLVAENDLYCSLGTTAWLAFLSSQPLIDPHQRVFNIISLDGQHQGVFGTIQNAGKAVEWAVRALGFNDPRQLDQFARQSNPGSDGLVFLPYLDGERSPVFDAKAKGVFYGLSSEHARSHLARSVLEGTGYALNSILEIFREKTELNDMRLIGGGAKSDVWRQILADIMRINVWTLNIPSADATSIGAALAAGTGAGLFSSLAEASRLIKNKTQTSPRSETQSVYEEGMAVFKQLYPSLQSVFQNH